MHTTLLKYLTDAGQLYHRLLTPVRESSGLTQAELDILLFLANNPEYNTASDIVSLRHLAKSNVSVGIKGLTSKNLLFRCVDEKDRRVEHLLLTPAAAPVVALGRECQQQFGALLLEDFSPEDRKALEHLMNRIQQNVSQTLDNII